MLIQIHSVTGKHLQVEIKSTECTVLQLKQHIYLQEGIPVEFQAITFSELVLRDELKLKDCNVTEGTQLCLTVKARSGPLAYHKCDLQPSASSQFVPAPTRIYRRSDTGGELSPSGEECTLTPFDQEEAERRADENLRTMAKMKDIRCNMEKLKNDRKQRKSSIPTDQKPGCSGINGQTGPNAIDSPIFSSNRQRKLSSSAVPVAVNTSSRRTLIPKSAPEDTSAKESSAGETEFELELHSRPMQIHKSQRSCGVPSSMKSGGMARPRNQRAGSSSSEQESSAALLTASDSELAIVIVEDEVEEEYWSYDETNAGGCQNVNRLPDSTDPSEMSSGMIICDMDHEFRKSKVKRRYAIPAGKVTPAESNPQQACSSFVGSSSVIKRPIPGPRNRPRSKARYPGAVPCAPVVNPEHNIISTCEGESSTDDDAKSDRSVGHITPHMPLSLPSNSGALARKLTAQMARVKMRGIDRTQLNHKQPQSSQSQLRCATCGYRLTNTTTFHCRCGKTCCVKHRNPETHMCSYFALDNKATRHLGFVPECSD